MPKTLNFTEDSYKQTVISATLLVSTDRLDLNDQLHNTFASCSGY